VLSTERLIVRPFRESDYQDLFEYLSLEEIYRYEPGRPVTLEEAKNIAAERAGGTNFWAATLKDTGKLIGHVSLFQMEPEHLLTWEVGYIFSPVFQNRGYASEATRAVIEYAFTILEAHRVVGRCNPENISSWKVLEKCGMKREGLLRKNVYFHKDKNGRPLWTDSFEYAMLAEDFINK
jgi:ribosomal-protein-alanine N-acetyltransferase